MRQRFRGLVDEVRHVWTLHFIPPPKKNKENEKKAQDTSRKHVLLMTGLAGGVSWHISFSVKHQKLSISCLEIVKTTPNKNVYTVAT
jgi:hypothetical protein